MNSNFEIKDNIAIIKINKEIYPKEVLIQASYIQLEKYYILIDKDKDYFIVSLKFKEENENNDLEKAVFEFFDELIEAQSYLNQIQRTSKIREVILEQALLGQTVKNGEVFKEIKVDQEMGEEEE